jgi:4-aminobutyrate aminotransferase
LGNKINCLLIIEEGFNFMIEKKISIGSIPPGKKSQSIIERMKKSVGLSNYTGLYGVVLDSGSEQFIKDVDGNIFLDSLSCASSCILGYGIDDIRNTYNTQASSLQQSCFTYSPNEPTINLAEKLIQITPGNFDKRVLFGLSGSDANGGAIKAMRKYTKNFGIIHFKNDYHGSTGLSQEASDFGDLNDGIFPKESIYIEYDYPTNQSKADEIFNLIYDDLKKRKAGGIILEAIQGDAGVIIPPENFLKSLRKITEDTDTILIVDEVQSGMGRTGSWWSFEHENIIPDILVTAKGLSAGYVPISAIIGREDILNSLEPGQHIFTYGGHPPSAAIALRVIQYVEENHLIENASTLGKYIIESLCVVKQKYGNIILDVRGRGLMIGVEINVSTDELAGKIFATRCMEKGVYVGFYGANANTVRIEPPLTITKEQADIIIQIIDDTAQEMQSGNIPKFTIDNVRKYSIGI